MLGLAYKPNTHSVKNSPSIALVTQLKEYQIKAHDPIVTDQHITHVTQYADMLDAIYGADIVIVMNPCTEYQNLSIERILKHMRGKTIIDPYRALKAGQDYSLDLNY
ncbi:MAG: GDP-mannose dehydrogenase, partial [Gammaproteobacteria bacterium]|nr:GDP-mannose dehydrogenase [Gammaproteobacteria bacterium]